MDRKHFALTYTKFVARELWCFAFPRPDQKAKNGKARRQKQTQPRCNKDQAFKFVHLPGEFRNKIYTELLTLQERGPYNRVSCWPEILATSKQINSEANEILYADNAIEMTAAVKFSRTGPLTAPVYSITYDVRITCWNTTLCRSDLIHPKKYVRNFTMPFLTKMHHFRLNVGVENDCPHPIIPRWLTSVYDPLGDFIDRLSENFAAKNNIKSFHVDVQIDKPHFAGDDDLLKKTLWPLARLRRPDAFKFTGLSSEVVCHLQEAFKQYYCTPMGAVDYAMIFMGLSYISPCDEERETIDEGSIIKAVGRKLERIHRVRPRYDQRLIVRRRAGMK